MPKPVAENADTISKLTLQLVSPTTQLGRHEGDNLFVEMLNARKDSVSTREKKNVVPEQNEHKTKRREKQDFSPAPIAQQQPLDHQPLQALKRSDKSQARTTDESQSTSVDKTADTKAIEAKDNNDITTTDDTAHDTAVEEKESTEVRGETVAGDDAEKGVKDDVTTEDEAVSNNSISNDVASDDIVITSLEEQDGELIDTESTGEEDILADNKIDTISETDRTTESSDGNNTVTQESASKAAQQKDVDTKVQTETVGESKIAENLTTVTENADTTTSPEDAPLVSAVTSAQKPDASSTETTESAEAVDDIATNAPRSEESSRTQEEKSNDEAENSDSLVEGATEEKPAPEHSKHKIAESVTRSESIASAEKQPTHDSSEIKNIVASAKIEHSVKAPVSEHAPTKGEVAIQSDAKADQAIRTQTPKSTVKMANQSAMIHRIASNVRLMVGRKQSSIRMDLDPPELGKMQLRLSMKGTSLTGHMRVESVEAKNLITHNVDALKNALAKEGITISEFSVDVDARQQSGGFEHHYRSSQQMAQTAIGSLEIPETLEAVTENIMTQDRLNLIA